jgi:hypothetical protein
MTTFSGDLAHIRRAELLREAERVSLVSRSLRAQKAIRRERAATKTLRPVRQAWVLASAAIATLRG